MHRSLALIAAGTAGLPTVVGLAALPASAIAATSHDYRGTATTNRWGRYQVVITVSGKRITALRASYPTERQRSASINNRAVPILRSEVLRAQSASIHQVSGATMTSRSFVASLQTALRAAHL